MLGINSTGLMVMQGVGAVIGGTFAQVIGQGATGAARALAVMAVLSILVNRALGPGLRRSRATAEPAAAAAPA